MSHEQECTLINEPEYDSYGLLTKANNPLTYKIIGAAMEVHRELGPGYLEGLYEEALEKEFRRQNILALRQHPVEVLYKGEPIGQSRLDFLVENNVVLELKAVETIAGIHRAQVMSYLKASKLRVGLLINFNVEILKDGIQRIAL